MSKFTELEQDLLKVATEDRDGCNWYKWSDVVSFTQSQITAAQKKIEERDARIKLAENRIVKLSEENAKLNDAKDFLIKYYNPQDTRFKSMIDSFVSSNDKWEKLEREFYLTNDKLQSALDVAVEGLGFFATEGFYRMTDFITTSPVAEVGKMPENIKVYGNPVLTLGLKKATEALDKIKQIREKTK